MLYIRMFVLMFITLYTSRVVLDVLGVEDYGIYNVVGGVIALLSFVNNAMSISVQRYFSFEIGKNEKGELNNVFNVSVHAHLLIAIVFVFVAETLGLWFLKTQMTLPSDRYEAAFWVYQCVVFSGLLAIVQVPYIAMIIAKEKMSIYAYLSIVDAVLKLLIVYLLFVIDFDKLIVFAILNMIVNSIIIICYCTYGIKIFEETKIKTYWNYNKFKEILQFAVWSMLGEISWVLTLQGVNILLNLFFGPIVNAARGIAFQVNSAVSKFVQGFQTAVNPQLIKSYATGNPDQMINLLFRSTRFSVYLLLIFVIPLIVEMDYILSIWLVDVPEHTAIFCRLVLVSLVTDTLSSLFAQIPRACGKIKRYQMVVSMFLLLNFPISYFALYKGASPETTMYIYIFISIALLFVRLIMCRRLVVFSFAHYAKNVIRPVAAVIFVSTFAMVALIWNYRDFVETKPVFTLLISFIFVIIPVILVGLEKSERAMCVLYLKSKLKK